MRHLDLLRLVFLAVVVSALTGTSSAQSREPTHRITNSPSATTSGGYGRFALGISDMDGDGFADYAVAAPSWPFSAPAGRVYVFSGRTSQQIQVFDCDQGTAEFGLALGDVGDIDGDGFGDLVVAAHNYDFPGLPTNAGRLFCYSGATGLSIWTTEGTQSGGNFGRSLGAIADATGDGIRDLVVGEPGSTGMLTGSGRVHLVDGASGAVLCTVDGVAVFDNLGRTLATRPDSGTVLAATSNGKVYSLALIPSGTGSASLYLAAVPGTNVAPQLALVRAAGGAVRLLVGRSSGDTNGFSNNGTVQLFDLSSTVPVLSLAGAATLEQMGASVTAVFDADGDGTEEIGFTSSGSGLFVPNRVRIVTQSGVVVDDVTRQGAVGSLLTSIPDATGDGRGEWIEAVSNGVSAIFESTMFSGGLDILSTTTTATTFRVDFAIDAGAAAAGAVYLQVYSFSGVVPGTLGQPGWPLVPIVADDLTTLAISLIGSPFFPDAAGTLGPTGTATTTFQIPASFATALSGFDLSTAAVRFDPSLTDVVFASNPVIISF